MHTMQISVSMSKLLKKLKKNLFFQNKDKNILLFFDCKQLAGN